MILHQSLGGACYGPRFWVPLLPVFAILFARCFASTRSPWLRGSMILALILGLLVNVPAALSSYESWSKPFYAPGATLFQRMLN